MTELIQEKKEKELIVKKNVKEYLNAKEFNASSEIIDDGALNLEVKKILDEACKRASANGRKTIKARDL